VFGKEDRTTPLYMAKKLNQKIKNSKLIIIEDAGHFAFAEKPWLFNVYLKECLLGD
jgi:pimeloyl-ACP methyl ester carboxylesterase